MRVMTQRLLLVLLFCSLLCGCGGLSENKALKIATQFETYSTAGNLDAIKQLITSDFTMTTYSRMKNSPVTAQPKVMTFSRANFLADVAKQKQRMKNMKQTYRLLDSSYRRLKDTDAAILYRKSRRLVELKQVKLIVHANEYISLVVQNGQVRIKKLEVNVIVELIQ